MLCSLCEVQGLLSQVLQLVENRDIFHRLVTSGMVLISALVINMWGGQREEENSSTPMQSQDKWVMGPVHPCSLP